MVGAYTPVIRRLAEQTQGHCRRVSKTARLGSQFLTGEPWSRAMFRFIGRQIGIAQRLWRSVFGARDEAEWALKEATSHGASLMNLRMLLAAKHLPKDKRAEAIIDAINHLSPDVARAELEAERGRLQEAIAGANARAFQQLSSAILHLAATGELPEWVTQQAPELAGLKFGSFGRSGGNRGAKAPVSEPRSRSDAARFWLHSSGVTPGKTPAGRKGIWLKSSDLPS
jgi:hypothetical protein